MYGELPEWAGQGAPNSMRSQYRDQPVLGVPLGTAWGVVCKQLLKNGEVEGTPLFLTELRA